jgi:hypothetical protein
MSSIHTQVWILGTPACCGAHCGRPIADMSQAVVVTHQEGSMGFCSLYCFLETFGPASSTPPARELPGEEDLLHALGYHYPREEKAAE